MYHRLSAPSPLETFLLLWNKTLHIPSGKNDLPCEASIELPVPLADVVLQWCARNRRSSAPVFPQMTSKPRPIHHNTPREFFRLRQPLAEPFARAHPGPSEKKRFLRSCAALEQ